MTDASFSPKNQRKVEPTSAQTAGQNRARSDNVNPAGKDVVAPRDQAAAKRALKKARKALRAQIGNVPAPATPSRTAATPAQMKKRHFGLIFSFILLVLTPIGASSWYLYSRATDQYASTLGFVVRSEDASSAADVFSGLSSTLGGSGQHDSDILYEFIRSAELVRLVDKKLNIRSAFSRYNEDDPLFGFDLDGTIEDLTQFWRRTVRISYDTGSGLIEVRVLAFDPQEAQNIAREIFTLSSEMINNISAIARSDATRYAEQDLTQAVERLKSAREALTAFRLSNEIVDPSADIQGQMGLLNTLQAQLANALIEFDLLNETARNSDPRLEQAKRRISVIEARINDERRKFSAEGQAPGGSTYAAIISEFERLTVDREFTERTYEAAQAAYDSARTEANRQSRYLAAYITPTLAERPEYPQRFLILAIVTLFSFLIWTISTLIFYAIRDRG